MSSAMVLDLPIFQAAQVTLDVPIAQVIWPWKVTMNLWAKSIATGVFLIGVFMMMRHPKSSSFIKRWMPLTAIVFIGITLLFTVLDLHQPFRAWHMFFYPHFTSMVNIGSWFINLYGAVLVLSLYAVYKQDDSLFSKLIIPGTVMAFLTQIYTAGLLAQANAREVWQAPTEVAQLLLSAALAGSAFYLIVGRNSLNNEEKRSLGYILGLSALISFTIFMSEVIFAPQKSEEAAFVINLVTHGELSTMFMSAMVLAFIVPMILVFLGRKSENPGGMLTLASFVALVGLWLAKHVWLIAPQMIPLS